MLSPERQELWDSTKENCSIMETSGHGKWYGPCTPASVSRSKSGSPRESPRLSLSLFAKTPRISFGKVKVGGSKVKRVVIDNPLTMAQSLYLDKSPEKKGFTILMPVPHGESLQSCEDGSYETLPRCKDFTVPAMSELDLPILWKPETEGNIRETVTLKLGDFNRLLIVLFGNAIDTAVKPKAKMKTLLPGDIRKGNISQKRKMSTIGSSASDHKKSPPKKVLQESNKDLPVPKNKTTTAFDVSAPMLVKPVKKVSENKDKGRPTKRTFKAKVAAKGVAQSRLNLVKKSTTESRNIPRHPLPFAAKNMYFDEKWMEKQERGFVQWINYILTPPDELTNLVVPESSSIFVMDVASADNQGSQHLAPTKEALSLRTYTARRKMARLRRCACLLYQSPPVAMVAKTVESEVEKNRLCIRPDKHFHQDLGIKETILNMLLSYNSLWLRIAIETIYGEILPIQSNNDIPGLRRFLKNRFLANPDIAKEYRHATVAEYYRPGYYEALKKFTLKKFLLLVLFLDKAKLTRLIDHDPCLFNKDAQYKCSRDLLLSFSRDYLKGEGDVTKHLSFLNYTVSHIQVPLDEMDYAVKNLAVDLRDGLRITRVIELLTQNWTLSSSLRVPSISRLQKIHNVEVSLNALKERGVFDDDKEMVNPRHIVDGHREKTLSFLWLIILHFQVNLVVNEKQLKEEISFLEKYYRMTKTAVARQEAWDEPPDVYAKSEKLGLLLEWCRAVCRLYDVKVENFTVSMSDGRVLCYLLHYYHPCLVREEDICQETTQTCNPYTKEDDSFEDDSLIMENWVSSHDKGFGGSTRLRELKENERKNHELCRKKVQELGGVPSMLKFADMSSTIPDEKVLVTYVSYLCARLLDLKDEGRAARTIQVAWRRYLQTKQAKELKRKTRAAMVIQKYFRIFLEKKRQEVLARSTLIIQAFCRGYQARRDVKRRHCAAAVIQKSYRSYRAMKEIQRNYNNLKQATLTMQALVRGTNCRRYVMRIRAARLLQSYWRRYLARRHFLSVKNSAIILQAHVRMVAARRRYSAFKMASVVIQRRYRARNITKETRRGFLALKRAVTVLQARRRGVLGRRKVEKLRAVICIQASTRMWRCRREYTKTKRGIIKVQSLVRRNIARKRYCECVSSARLVQTQWRAYQLGKAQRSAYEEIKTSAVVIQAHWRSHVVRRQFVAKKDAAVLIQASVRGFFVRKEVERWTTSCRVIQKYFRACMLMKKVAKEYKRKKHAVIKLQEFWRGRATRVEYLQTRKAIVSVQACVRSHLVRAKYLRKRSATIVLQTRYRAMRAMRSERQTYVRTRDAIVTLQASFRGNLVRRQVQTMNMAATRIQSCYRGHTTRSRYLRIKRSTVVIQRRYRAWSVARQVLDDYKRLRHAVVIIQKYTRGLRIRKEMKVMSEAAVTIQASFRGYRAKKDYSTLKVAVVKVQRGYRSLCQFRATREDYVKKRTCVIRLQSALRRFLCVRDLQRKKAAVRVLETRWRAVVVSRQARENYHRIRGCVLTIQAFTRGMKARTEVRRERAAILVQSYWRGAVQRHRYLEKRDATVKIQSCYRMLSERRKYTTLKERTVYLQRLVRANQVCRRQTMTYGITRGAVITLQAALRGHFARKQLETMTTAAVKIQSSFRRYFARRQYLEMRRSAVVIQRRRRALVTSRQTQAEYQCLRRSVILLQSLVRGRIARRQFKDSYGKVIHLQTVVRGFLARTKYHRHREAAMVIQQQYRAYRKGCAVYFSYNLQRGACITLQAHTRAWLLRRRYLRMKNAAQVIQLYHRATSVAKQQRHEYLQMRAAAVSIQAFTRGWITRQARKRSRAATCIQSWWRMSVVRREYGHEYRRVVVVQSLVRRWLCMKRYQELQYATVNIQRRFRANQLCMKERDLYMEKKGSCLLIQHSYRYYRQRRLVTNMLRSVSELRAAAVCIQRRYRANQLMESTRRNYFVTRRAVITLQAALRGHQARVYVGKIRAAIVIQSYYRRYRQRLEYTRLRWAAVKVQALIRGKQVFIEYRELRAATVVLQRRERARVQGVTQRKVFLAQKSSAIVIQSYIKGYQQRRCYQRLRNAAIKIQALVRGKQVLREYRELYAATVVLQRRERARVQAVTQRKAFLAQRSSAVVIQSCIRGYQQRRCYQRLRNAAINVQALVRGKQVLREYRKVYAATVVLQRRERARVQAVTQRKAFLAQKSSAVVIQSYIKGYQQRRCYQRLRSAAIKIQALVRGKQVLGEYRELYAATVVLQRRERARVQGVTQRKAFLVQRASAVVIQSYVRGYQQRLCYLNLRNAAIKIQAFERGRQECAAYTRLRAAAVVLQRRERARIIGKSQRNQFLQLKYSAIVTQSWLRGNWERKRFTSLKNATIKVQALARGKHARDTFMRLRRATVVIQRRVRANMMAVSQRDSFLEQKRSAVFIQSYVRGFQERRRYQQQRQFIIKVQARVKGHQQHKHYVTMRLAAITIQKHYRAFQLGRETLRHYQELRSATVLLQSIYRGNCARQFAKRIRSVIAIQAAFRCYATRKWYLGLRDAIIHMQATQRMKKEQEKYRELRCHTMLMQRRVIANQMCYRERTKYQRLRNTIIQLQAFYRGWRAREHVRRIRAARLIQRQYRAYVEGRCARVDFVRKRRAAITVQSWYRGNVAREQFKRERGARVIQAYVRGYQVRKEVEKIRRERAASLLRFSAAVYVNLMAVRLQRSYKKARAIALVKQRMDRLVFLQRWWRARRQRLHFLRVKHLVCVVQRSWRLQLAVRNQAVTKIQALVRTFLAKQTSERRKTAITTIQSFWRGWLVRKQCKSTKIKKARERIRLANNRATEPMKLCNRTRSALDYLLKCKNLTTVLGALVNLEVASRLSRRCTEQLVADNALSIIFKVVRNTNRSLAHIELIKHALAIFINVSKCPTTHTAVVDREPNSLDTLVELACIFRENLDIFPKACHLLTILSQNDTIRQDLLNTEKAVSKLTSAYTLTKRKHDRDMKRNHAKRLSMSSQPAKKKSNNSLTPLSAVTALAGVLGLVAK